MNIEELREQLEQLAGPQMHKTAEAREGVRRRVGRNRRRMGSSGALALVFVVAIVGFGVWNAQDSPVRVGTVPQTTPRAHEFECETGVEAVPKTGVPLEVFAWADGAPVVGHGQLWTVRSLLNQEPTFHSDVWRTKIGWFTKPFGIPRFSGRRLDGPGTFHGDANRATDASGTWVASSLEFSAAGCWEVTASYENAQIMFRILVGDPPRPLAIGTVAGTLRLVGGQLSVTFDSALRGTIRFAVGDTRWETTTATGKFRFDLPVGTYMVSATSPTLDLGRHVCFAEEPVVVTRGRTTAVDIVCEAL